MAIGPPNKPLRRRINETKNGGYSSIPPAGKPAGQKLENDLEQNEQKQCCGIPRHQMEFTAIIRRVTFSNQALLAILWQSPSDL